MTDKRPLLFLMILLAGLLFSLFRPADAEAPPLRKICVVSIGELRSAIESARPGDLIEVADGEYQTNEPILIKERQGTAENPLLIRAQNRGAAAITGKAGFRVEKSAYVVIEGFRFVHKPDNSAIYASNSHHMRISRNRFRLDEADNGPKCHWVVLTGLSHDNRIDRNLFEDKRALGNFICTWGVREPDYICSQHDLIDHNHFRNVGPRVDNGKEAIKIADSEFGMRDRPAFQTIECNVFENCSGEAETISVKSSDNMIRYNTLLGCGGSVSLRCGSRNTVMGNVFLNPATAKQCGGVKVYGRDHKVFNNYFEGLTGDGHTAPLALMSGEETPQGDAQRTVPLTPRAANTVIVFNTWVNCASSKASLQLGWPKDEARPAPPKDCVFANNIIVGDKGQLITIFPDVINLALANNIVSASGSARTGVNGYSRDQFLVVDPFLEKSPGRCSLWRPAIQSPARNGAGGDYPYVIEDIDGDPRMGQKDIGADQYSGAQSARRALLPEDVGPDVPY